jgi:hypothetical protein
MLGKRVKTGALSYREEILFAGDPVAFVLLG